MKIYFGFRKDPFGISNNCQIISNSKTIENRWYLNGGEFSHDENFKFPIRLYKIIDWKWR